MAKSIVSNLKKVTITGILNNEDRLIENEGETIDLDVLFDKYDGYNIKIELSEESSKLDDEEKE